MKMAFIVKLAKIIFLFPNFIPHIKTRISILLKEGPTIRLKGKGCFNQEVVFFGKGVVIIGNGFSFGYRYGGGFRGALCEIQPRTKEAIITIGDNIATNNGVVISAASTINIGDYCLIGQDVMIIDHDAHGIHPDERRSTIGNVRPINIGNKVWIGSRAIILPGTILGDNCVVGAGAVVKGCFPPNSIIAGNPATIIKFI